MKKLEPIEDNLKCLEGFEEETLLTFPCRRFLSSILTYYELI